MLGEPAPVGIRVLIVLGEDVGLDLHHARLAEPGRMRMGRPLAVVVGVIAGMAVTMRMGTAVAVSVCMVMIVPVRMPAFVRMAVRMILRLVVAFYPRLALATSANRTHCCPPPTYSLSVNDTSKRRCPDTTYVNQCGVWHANNPAGSTRIVRRRRICKKLPAIDGPGTASTGRTKIMLMTTTSSVEGRNITDYLGVIAGEAILGANLFRDLFAGIRDIVGGRSGAYEKELRKAREIAFREIQSAAEELGANAVVGIDIDYEVVGEKGGMLMVSVSGTAVRVDG